MADLPDEGRVNGAGGRGGGERRLAARGGCEGPGVPTGAAETGHEQDPPAPEPWPKVGAERVGEFRIFRVRRDFLRMPRTGDVLDRFVLEMPDWVNVVPVLPDGRLVLVEQFRPGTGEITLEFPAGIIEPGEDPCAAGLRELEEETGYRAESCRLLGVVAPNPATQDNRLAVVLASGCTATGQRAFDEGEDLVVRVVDRADVERLIAAGRITHALTIVTWYLYTARSVGLGIETRDR